jgi:ferrous iron transport protein A
MFKGWNCRKGRRCCSDDVREGDHGVLPLADAPTGKRLRVACLGGGRQFCARMASMGIYPGVEMELVCSSCGSPCLVRVHGGTLSLGAGLSRDIMVVPEI